MKHIPYLIIAALLLYIWIDSCNRKPDPLPLIQTITIPGDSFPVPYPVVTPGVDSIIYDTDTVYQDIDTAAILMDYFAKVYGRDTLANDTSVLVYVDWMVMTNDLIYLKPYIQNRRAKVVNYITYPEPVQDQTFGLRAGFGAYVSPVGSDLFPVVAVQYRKLLISYGYGIRGSHVVGVSWRFI